MKFIGSLQFTNQGLDKLVKTLGDDEFRYLSESCISSHFGLVRRKGVYPYDYMDSSGRFEETKLPDQAQIQSMYMQLECGMLLGVRRLQITTISICS